MSVSRRELIAGGAAFLLATAVPVQADSGTGVAAPAASLPAAALATAAPVANAEGTALVAAVKATVGYPMTTALLDEVTSQLASYPTPFAKFRAVPLNNDTQPSSDVTRAFGTTARVPKALRRGERRRRGPFLKPAKTTSTSTVTPGAVAPVRFAPPPVAPAVRR